MKTCQTQRQLRTALGQCATGVAVASAVTGDGRPVGMTINSFGALSLDPPLILWCLRHEASRGAAFTEADHFAINVLAAGQAHLARRFATWDDSGFTDLAWHPGPWCLPLLDGVLGVFVCRRSQLLDGGDHLILIGHLEDYEVAAERQPLIFHGGRYRALTDIPVRVSG